MVSSPDQGGSYVTTRKPPEEIVSHLSNGTIRKRAGRRARVDLHYYSMDTRPLLARHSAKAHLPPRLPNHRLIKLVRVEVFGKDAAGCLHLQRHPQGLPLRASPAAATRGFRNVLCLHPPSAPFSALNHLTVPWGMCLKPAFLCFKLRRKTKARIPERGKPEPLTDPGPRPHVPVLGLDGLRRRPPQRLKPKENRIAFQERELERKDAIP